MKFENIEPIEGDQILNNDGDCFDLVVELIGENLKHQFIVKNNKNKYILIQYISKSCDRGYEGHNLWRQVKT